MPNLSEKFEEYLQTLPPDEWSALKDRVERVRTPAPAPPAAPLPNERVDEPQSSGRGVNAGLAEARRRGYVGDDGKPVKR